MPLYEYECKKCHHRFERIQKFSDPYVKKCPDCGGPVELVVSAPAVQFKGSGWYVNDYAKKSSELSSSKTDSGSKGEGSDKGDSEPKGDSDSRSSKEDKSKQDSSGSNKKTEKKTASREKS